MKNATIGAYQRKASSARVSRPRPSSARVPVRRGSPDLPVRRGSQFGAGLPTPPSSARVSRPRRGVDRRSPRIGRPQFGAGPSSRGSQFSVRRGSQFSVRRGSPDPASVRRGSPDPASVRRGSPDPAAAWTEVSKDRETFKAAVWLGRRPATTCGSVARSETGHNVWQCGSVGDRPQRVAVWLGRRPATTCGSVARSETGHNVWQCGSVGDRPQRAETGHNAVHISARRTAHGAWACYLPSQPGQEAVETVGGRGGRGWVAPLLDRGRQIAQPLDLGGRRLGGIGLQHCIDRPRRRTATSAIPVLLSLRQR